MPCRCKSLERAPESPDERAAEYEPAGAAKAGSDDVVRANQICVVEQIRPVVDGIVSTAYADELQITMTCVAGVYRDIRKADGEPATRNRDSNRLLLPREQYRDDDRSGELQDRAASDGPPFRKWRKHHVSQLMGAENHARDQAPFVRVRQMSGCSDEKVHEDKSAPGRCSARGSKLDRLPAEGRLVQIRRPQSLVRRQDGWNKFPERWK